MGLYGFGKAQCENKMLTGKLECLEE